MKTLLKRLFGLRLHAHEKVKVAGGKGTSALSMFTKAHKQISKANELLSESAMENRVAMRELEEANKRIESYLKANNKVAEKLSEFIPANK